MAFSKNFQVKWADIDANRHLRHSAYYDYGAQVRILFFDENGYSMQKFAEIHLGPILFREEAVFMKEIFMNEKITVDMRLAASRNDGTKWKFVHSIYKENGEKAAQITVEGAFMDLLKRKLTYPPEELLSLVEHLEKTENYELWPDREKK
jgi:acyl-CoA thioester hydrolase